MQLQSHIADLGDENRNAGESRLGKRWTTATKEILPVVLASKPANHKGGDPFLMGALGSQYGSSSPSGEARVEDLGDGRALKGSPEQDPDKPHEPE